MTKEEFKDLQLDLQQSGMSITKYLQHVGINYNTYHYWRKKLKESESPKPELAIKGFVFGSRMAEEDIDFIMKTFSGQVRRNSEHLTLSKVVGNPLSKERLRFHAPANLRGYKR